MKTNYTKQKQLLIWFFLFFISVNSFSQCWSKIASGGGHTLAIADNGTLWAWGRNGFGQLGVGILASQGSTIPIQIGTATNWKDIAAGSAFSVAIRSGGLLGELGTLWAWGSNNVGQLGDGTFNNRNIPTQIGTGFKWKQISASSLHVMAISDTGLFASGDRTLWGWGRNNYGQLGNGITSNQNTPIQIGTAIDWDHVEAGASFTVALKEDGRLFAWGVNASGQLGINSTINTTVRTQIGTATDWTRNFAASFFGGFTLAIKNNGTLWAWGYNQSGQLGTGTTTNSLLPIQVGTNIDWAKIDAGENHTISLKTDGTVYSWGGNTLGQLGIGNFNPSLTRNLVAFDTQAISAGRNSNFVLQYGQTVSWGHNSNGELGNGTVNTSTIPILIDCPAQLGIAQLSDNSSKFVVYPNPTSNGSFSIQSEIPIQNVIAFDILGKQIDIERNNDSYKVNASAGIYTIKISDDNGNSQIKKLILN